MLGWGVAHIEPLTPEQLISRKHIASAAAAAAVPKQITPTTGPADWAYWNVLLMKTAPMNLREGDVKYNYFAADGGPERVSDWAIEQYAFESELREIASAFGGNGVPPRQLPEWVTEEFKEVAEYRKSIRRGRAKTSPLFAIVPPMPPPERTYADVVQCQPCQ
jgi:hypothetical protein